MPVWTGAGNLAPTRIRSLYRPVRSESLQDDQEWQHGTRFAGIDYVPRTTTEEVSSTIP